MSILSMALLAIRFLLELSALAALGYWGFRTGGGLPVKLLLGTLAPLTAAVVWGAFIAPKAAFPVAVPIRILLEAAVFGSAAAALYASGHARLALVFVIVVIVDSALVYLLKL